MIKQNSIFNLCECEYDVYLNTPYGDKDDVLSWMQQFLQTITISDIQELCNKQSGINDYKYTVIHNGQEIDMYYYITEFNADDDEYNEYDSELQDCYLISFNMEYRRKDEMYDQMSRWHVGDITVNL